MPSGRSGFCAGLLLLLACGSHEAPPSPKLEVVGDLGAATRNIMGASFQSIWVWQDGAEVDDALVEIDGRQLYAVCAGCGRYQGSLSSEPVAGRTLSLRVTRGPSVVTGSGAVPESPVLTSPADGGTYASEQAIPVAWTSSSQPDRFEVEAQHTCGNATYAAEFDAFGWERALTIPAYALGLCFSPVTVVLSVRAINAGSLGGDYVPHSGDGTHPGMNIAARSNQATLRQ